MEPSTQNLVKPKALLMCDFVGKLRTRCEARKGQMGQSGSEFALVIGYFQMRVIRIYPSRSKGNRACKPLTCATSLIADH